MSEPSAIDLHQPLRRYWGYDQFRPMQERIIQSILAGKDTAVVMPTGGGKSLCYQLPAVVSNGTAIVISPLIALMQDQAAQLAEMGIAAAVLNSSIPWPEQSQVISRAAQGAYRLLYLSPERLAKPETVAWLSRVPIAFFAIDEAHCISEWGHEFRPEYRQLSTLRANFPGKPIAAFTASATQRVRHDILAQLQLHDPAKYICSFHRPNLQYLVRQCENSRTQARLLVGALRAHAGDNVIVYAPTIARVEETVDFLAEKGIAAVPYHAKMDSRARQRNQERWMSDEVRVLVGTIAFGLGINKAAVRAVIHLSLPKSVEQYYQEAGRAGRDGLPSECALLWQKKDAGLLAHFIEAVTDRAEKERAWQRYHVIRRFAESATCRHRQICLHFGETPKWEQCGMCDVCAEVPGWFGEQADAATVAVERRDRRRQSAGGSTQAAGGRGQAAGGRRQAAETSGPPIDSELVEYLKEWRRGVAVRDNVPAFMVLHDATLEDLCRKQPRTHAELLHISGIGERKAVAHGAEILMALEAFRKGARAAKQEAPKVSPAEETMRLLKEGRNFEEIAQLRERRLATVVDLVAELVERGRLEFDPKWIAPERREQIEAAIQKLGADRMKTIKDALPPEVTYGEIRLVAAKFRRALK
ncbi:MAG TPA: RecQ family ATP-dependent DNA helicase [Bryobacteraceae bacterium]|nr:RecQ family ATP-dependent DNA helicase [Bryobacteraceae bacterium]